MTVLVVVPQLSLSGLVFPINSMPDWARALVEVIPLAHYLRIIKSRDVCQNFQDRFPPQCCRLASRSSCAVNNEAAS